MLLVAHDVNPLLADLDRVVYVAGGRIVSGPPEEVITSETLSALYGVPIEVLRTSDGRLVVVGQPEAPPHATGTTDRPPRLTRLRPLRLPVHGQRPRGGDDRRAHGRGRRVVHGAPPPELRRAHARGDVVSRARAAAALAGIPLALGYFGSCSIAALAIAAGSRGRDGRNRQQESAVIGTVQVAGFALGFLFLSLYSGVLESLETLLFGSFLGITQGQVLTLLAVAARRRRSSSSLVGRPLLYASIDPAARPGARRAGAAARAGVPARARPLRRGDRADHRRAARLRAPRRTGRGGAAADRTGRRSASR